MFKKYEKLKEIIRSKESLIIAHSGGVDSTFLLYAANEVLKDKALGITVSTPYMAQWELEDANTTAKEIGANHTTLNFAFIDEIKDNPPLRCYLCKHSLFSNLLIYAKDNGFLWVSEGSNVDDTSEHRPGRVALGELGITTPLLEAGLYKKEIRELSKKFNLSTWDKPSYPCLLTRFEHYHLINKDELTMVNKAEEYMITNGYKNIRVRFRNKKAVIEMPLSDQNRLLGSSLFEDLLSYFENLGFLQVSFNMQKIITKI